MAENNEDRCAIGWMATAEEEFFRLYPEFEKYKKELMPHARGLVFVGERGPVGRCYTCNGKGEFERNGKQVECVCYYIPVRALKERLKKRLAHV